MERKNLVIYSGGLVIGGVEKVLLNLINNIDLNKYNVTLLILNDYEKKKCF